MKNRPRVRAPLIVATLLATLLNVGGVARAASAVASISVLSTLTASETISFSNDVWNVRSDNVVLRLQDSTADLATWLSCINASGRAVDCRLGPVRRVVLRPASSLTPGQRYRVLVNPPEASQPVDDYLLPTAIPTASKPFIASLFEQENSVAATYLWRSFQTSSAIGGSYQADYLSGSAVTFGFNGRNFTWYTVLSPSQGRAQLYIDGVNKGTVNNYSSKTTFRFPRFYRGLASAYHRVTIKVLGQKGSTLGRGTWIAIDAVDVNSAPASPRLIFSWQRISDSHASGGYYVRAAAPYAHARFTFRGRSIDWITILGPTQGSATMYVDGTPMLSVNNRANRTHYGVVRRVSNLPDGIHTLDVVSGTGGSTSVDRFVVRLPDLTIFHGLGTWVDLFDYGPSGPLDPVVAVPQMKSHGVRTIYIETARYTSSSAFDDPTQVGQWIETAHANGMKIIGWYLPGYGTYLNNDVSRTVAIATYRSPAGQGFDGLGIDIETKATGQTYAAWMTDIATHLARVRSGATAAYSIGAIVVPPLVMDINSHWDGFPWAAVGQYTNVVLPMGYWSYRTDCSTNLNHCPYQYSLQNIQQARARSGGLLVHLIGGVADKVTAQGVTDYMKACRDAHAYGAGLYDYRTTSASFWTILAGANSL